MIDLDKEIKELKAELAAKQKEKEKQDEIKRLKEKLAFVEASPLNTDAEFVGRCLALVKSGKVLYRDEAKRYRTLYKTHATWFKRQGYPNAVPTASRLMRLRVK